MTPEIIILSVYSSRAQLLPLTLSFENKASILLCLTNTRCPALGPTYLLPQSLPGTLVTDWYGACRSQVPEGGGFVCEMCRVQLPTGGLGGPEVFVGLEVAWTAHHSSALALAFQPLPVTHSPSSSTSCHSLQPLLFPPSIHSRSFSAFVLLSGSSWWDLIRGPSYPQRTQMCWVESLTRVPLNLCLVH